MLTGQVSSNAKDRLEACFFGDHLVLQTVFDIERV